MAEFAICSTTYNCAPRLEASLRSLREMTKGLDCEWRVVDNVSKDGTWEILTRWMAETPGFVAVQEHCNRGKGRQLAFEASTAPHVIVVDLDTVYLPLLGDLLRKQLTWSRREEFVLHARFLDLGPRRIFEDVGGWRTLNHWEDLDLQQRLRHFGAFAHLKDGPLGENWDVPDPESRQESKLLPYLWRHFRNTRDDFRSGMGISLLAKIRLESRQTRRPLRFWISTVPMMAVAWLSQAGTRKPRPAAPESIVWLAIDDLKR